MAKRFAYVSSFADRHGKRRYRFRRNGYPTRYFQAAYGTKDFEREYAACLDAEPAPVGVGRIKPGTVSDVIARYYADNAFQDLRPATQAVYRGWLHHHGRLCCDWRLPPIPGPRANESRRCIH